LLPRFEGLFILGVKKITTTAFNPNQIVFILKQNHILPPVSITHTKPVDMISFATAFLFLGLGILLGAACAWLIAKYRFAAKPALPGELEKNYVLKGVHEVLQQQLGTTHNALKKKEIECVELEKMLAGKERDLLYLEEKLVVWQKDFDALQKRAHTEFEVVANRLLEEKAQKFTAKNEEQINVLLQPLREKIREFGQDIDKRFTEEAKDVVSLKKEIEHLRELNERLGHDAQSLVTALKGDSKTQGDWGEFQLELLLEKAGLVKGLHYTMQSSFKDENGQDKRPDFIIQLPEGKHLVIDSKVSLTAYERYFNAIDDDARRLHLKDHTDSLRNHVRDLGSKNYQHLYQINSPDYLLLFVPIEPAFTAAIQYDNRLFLDALDRNVVIVTTTTLLATMRTVSYIWRQERQKKNVLEIARQSGLLYDKFVNFVEDLREVGLRLDHAQSAYHDAMNKLSDSKKYGDTLLGRAQKIKELGAKATKSLPPELTEVLEENGDGQESDS
jgi:DNA recombination protein RmuC